MAVLAYLVFLPEAKGGLLYTEGWRNYGLSASIIMFISILVSSLGTHRHIPHLRAPSVQPSDEGFSLRRTARELRETLGNPSFLVLFAAALFRRRRRRLHHPFYLLHPAHVGLHHGADRLSAVSLFLFGDGGTLAWAQGDPGVQGRGLRPSASPPSLWPWLRRYSSYACLTYSRTTVRQLSLIVLSHGAIEVALIITSSILVAAMIADVVEDSEIQTGRRSEGTFFAANTFAQKAVNGLGVLVAGQLLAWVEFPTGAALGTVSQETIFGLATYYIPVQWVLYGFAIVLMGLYRISRAGHEANIDRLRARRSSAPGDQPGEHTGAST